MSQTTLRQTRPIVAIVATDHTIENKDFGSTLDFSGPGLTLTLPDPTTVRPGFWCVVRQLGADSTAVAGTFETNGQSLLGSPLAATVANLPNARYLFEKNAAGVWVCTPQDAVDNRLGQVATTSSLGRIVVGGGLRVDPDGTTKTLDTVPYQARALTDLSTNPDGSGQGMGGQPLNPGYYWNAIGLRTIIVPDPDNPPDGTMQELENTCAPGTTEWQYYYWDGATASEIVNLNIGDYIEDITLNGGMTVKVYDDPANLSKKYLAVAQPVTDPAKFNPNGGYFIGHTVNYNGTLYTCIETLPATGSGFGDPPADPVHWILSAYAGGMGPMVGATDVAAGAAGTAPAPAAGEMRKALTGDGTWRAVTLAEPAPTDTANPEFAGNIIIRPSADEQTMFIDYRTTGGVIVSRAIESTAGLFDSRGDYDASVNAYPTTGGSGTAGAVAKGDVWDVTVAGTINGTFYDVGSTLRALVDSPAQVDANWTDSIPVVGVVAPLVVSASRALTNADHGRELHCTAALTLTRNSGLRADFRCEVVQVNVNPAQVTFANGTGAFVNSYSIGANAKTANQYAHIFLRQGPTANQTNLIGDITP